MLLDRVKKNNEHVSILDLSIDGEHHKQQMDIYLRSTDHQARNLQELQSALAWYTIVIDIYI